MPFPVELAKAQRASLLSSIIEAMDTAEECYRNLLEAQPHLYALDNRRFNEVRNKCQVAYQALFAARIAIEDADKNFSKKVKP